MCEAEAEKRIQLSFKSDIRFAKLKSIPLLLWFRKIYLRSEWVSVLLKWIILENFINFQYRYNTHKQKLFEEPNGF